MAYNKDFSKAISELLSTRKVDDTPIDFLTVQILEKIEESIQLHEDEESIQGRMVEAYHKQSQNQAYKDFLSRLDLNFDDFSKNSKETISLISSISTELGTRLPSEDQILSELISLTSNEREMEAKLEALREKNTFYEKIDADLNELLEKSEKFDKDLDAKKKEYNLYEKDIKDRVNDILEPKNREYSHQLEAFKKKNVDALYELDAGHDKIEFYYKKMKGLENSLAATLERYGDIGSIPKNYQEALQVLERKRLRAEELDKELMML